MISRSLRSAITVGVVVATAFTAPNAAAAPGPVKSGASAAATATRLSLTAGPTFAGCPVLPANSAFNTPIATSAVRPESAAVIANTSNSGGSFAHGTLQFGFWSNPLSGIQPIVVPSSQQPVPITYDLYGDESDPGPFPIPLDAPLEADSDHHLVVVQQGTCQLYELFGAHRSANGWSAASGAHWDLTANTARPARWTSADAAGLPIFPGLLRPDEVLGGQVRHALRVTVGRASSMYIPPANHANAADPRSGYLPMGARLRLRSDYDISGFTGQARVIAQALKTYGLIVADIGPTWSIDGVGDLRWDDRNLDQIRAISASALEYVDTGQPIPY